jgi:HD-like signal output (HDOD) protein
MGMTWNPFKKKKAAPESVANLPSGVRTTIMNTLGLSTIPLMPQAAQHAFELTTNPGAEAHDYIEVIEADESLSAKVLKIANSVFYDRGGGSKTIAEAVAVVGISELQGLLNATALANVFPLRTPIRNQLWAHDVATAITARLLARTLLPSCIDQAFLAGLMHDIGKLLMLHRLTSSYERVLKQAAGAGIVATEAEAGEYPFDHTEVGQLLAERWNFSAELTTTIRTHHQSWDDLPQLPQLSLTGIIKASDILAHALGLTAHTEPPALQQTYEQLLPAAWEYLRIPSGSQRGVIEEARRTFQHEHELFASWGAG